MTRSKSETKINEFCRCLPGDRPVQLVLNLGKVVFAKHILGFFETFIIQDELFGNELAQGGGPNAEFGGLIAVDAVTKGDDGVQAVELDRLA